MRARVILALILMLLFFPLTASFSDEIFAPFISKLEVKGQENKVILSWQDSSASIHHYTVFRSSELLSRENFSRAQSVAHVEPGKESFVDYPPSTKPYYYAVLAAKEDGSVYKLFIPYRNVTVNSVSIETTSSPEDRATQITSIKAETVEEEIRINFNRSKPDRPVIVYRSTSPLRSQEDLIDATALSTISSSDNTVSDYPLPGISYYYAVFDAQLAKAGSYSFRVGENSTSEPVELPLTIGGLSLREDRSKRSIPLPFLRLSESVLTGRELSGTSAFLDISREPDPLDTDTVKAFDALLREAPSEKRSEPSPQILPADRAKTTSGGTEYRLGKMVREGFSAGNWNDLQKDLEEFLKTQHTEQVETRARFYLAQTYFYTRNYRDAFLEFTLARQEYRVEVDNWLSVLYERLAG